MTIETIVRVVRDAVTWRYHIGPKAVSRLLDEIDRLRAEHHTLANALFKLEYAASGLNQEEHEAAYDIVSDLLFDEIQAERKRSRERVARMNGSSPLPLQG
jgi:hypothetical protein